MNTFRLLFIEQCFSSLSQKELESINPIYINVQVNHDERPITNRSAAGNHSLPTKVRWGYAESKLNCRCDLMWPSGS